MRILHLHSGNQFGGIERLLVTLAERSADAPGTEHVFALCFRGRLWNELTDVDAHVVHLGVARLARPETVLRARHAARRLIAGSPPDVVLTHLPWSRVVFGPVLRDVAGRAVHWVHGCGLRAGWLDRLADRYPPDACVYNSTYTASICSDRYPGLPSRVVYYPVQLPPPAEPRESVRERFATGPGDLVIVQASRMEAWKGHFDLVDAARLLPVEIPWVIWFAGGPQTVRQMHYYERLQTHVARSGIAMRVRFLGELADVSSVLHASDVFCQPNNTPEPFGISFVEAMSAALPVVATELGAAPELISDDTGALVSPHDPAALALALEAYLTNEDVRRGVGARGKTRALNLAQPAAQLAALTRFLLQVRGAA
jgi:glycosyltransferase involved in cell wall biosynthesis